MRTPQAPSGGQYERPGEIVSSGGAMTLTHKRLWLSYCRQAHSNAPCGWCQARQALSSAMCCDRVTPARSGASSVSLRAMTPCAPVELVSSVSHGPITRYARGHTVLVFTACSQRMLSLAMESSQAGRGRARVDAPYARCYTAMERWSASERGPPRTSPGHAQHRPM